MTGSYLSKIFAVAVGILGFLAGVVSGSEYAVIVWIGTIIFVMPCILLYYHLRNQESANMMLAEIADMLDELNEKIK